MTEKILLGMIVIFTFLTWVALLILGHGLIHETYLICMQSHAKGC